MVLVAAPGEGAHVVDGGAPEAAAPHQVGPVVVVDDGAAVVPVRLVAHQTTPNSVVTYRNIKITLLT